MKSVCSSDEALEVPHLHQPFCKLEGARDIALGITEDFVAQFRAAHDSAGNAALKELEVPVNCRSHLLHALFGHFAHGGGNFKLWGRASIVLSAAREEFIARAGEGGRAFLMGSRLPRRAYAMRQEVYAEVSKMSRKTRKEGRGGGCRRADIR